MMTIKSKTVTEAAKYLLQEVSKKFQNTCGYEMTTIEELADLLEKKQTVHSIPNYDYYQWEQKNNDYIEIIEKEY